MCQPFFRCCVFRRCIFGVGVFPGAFSPIRLGVSLVMIIFMSGCSISRGGGVSSDVISLNAESNPSVVDEISDTSPTLSRFAGKPTAIFFWSSWCKVCVSELPAIDRFAQQRPAGLAVYAVALLDSKDTAESAMKAAQFKVPVILDTKARIGRELGINGLPAMVLLDAHGKVQPLFKQASGPRDWDDPSIAEKIKRFLN